MFTRRLMWSKLLENNIKYFIIILRTNFCFVQLFNFIYSAVKEKLLENKKVAEATHNISAYRIQMDKGGLLQVFI